VNGALLVDALREREAHVEAEAILGRLGLTQGPVPPPAPFTLLLCARGRLRIAAGELESGLDDLLECGRRNERFEIRNPVFIPWRAPAALAYRAVGDFAAAIRLADQELAAARDWGTPGAIGAAEAVRALLADSAEERIDRLGRAATMLADSPARLEHARALIELGAALRRANRRIDARDPLRQGLELAHRSGATALAGRARAELEATGARPRRIVLSGVESLTPSELRVARMAGDGMANPEIAQALFVTRKTVEKHLGNAYMKLDIGSRKELPVALAGGSEG
jgi:DNA-binding CsgD family transcriptional regulator